MTQQLPNIMTLMRIVLAPIFLWSLFSSASQYLTLAVFLLAALTDFVDGWWARKYSVISNFGKIADPIADKALTGAAWIGLSLLGQIPVAATVLILVREVGITVWRLSMMNRRVLAADRGGKWKTTLQIVTICFYVIGWDEQQPYVAAGLLWFTVAFTTFTGLRYLINSTREVSDVHAG